MLNVGYVFCDIGTSSLKPNYITSICKLTQKLRLKWSWKRFLIFKRKCKNGYDEVIFLTGKSLSHDHKTIKNNYKCDKLCYQCHVELIKTETQGYHIIAHSLHKYWYMYLINKQMVRIILNAFIELNIHFYWYLFVILIFYIQSVVHEYTN